MKKALVSLLMLALALGMTACGPTTAETQSQTTQESLRTTTAPAEPEVVTLCKVSGAYLMDMKEQIDQWNAGEGKEKGIEIRLESPCPHCASLTKHLEGDGSYDLIDSGSNSSYVQKGWIKDLETVQNEQVRAVLESYRQYMIPGRSYLGGITTSVPFEALPVKMAVNVDLFNAQDLPLPQTWEEVVSSARIICEAAPGEVWGFGAVDYTGFFKQTVFKGAAACVETQHWDSETKSYSFRQYEITVKALAQMQADGTLFGMEDGDLLAASNEFTAGKLAMMPMISGDWGAFANSNPMSFEVAVIDMPAYDAQPSGQGVYEVYSGCSIYAPAYDAASERHREAVEEVWLFLNSEELKGALYARGTMIPVLPQTRENTQVALSCHGELWETFADLSELRPMRLAPDSVLTLDGASYEEVFREIVLGNLAWSDDVIAQLEARYNAAYQAAAADSAVDTTIFQ